MRTIRRILVAIKDPKGKVLPAVDKAAQLARAFGAEIELFHALSAPILSLDGFGDGGLADYERARRVQVRSRLESIAGPIREQGLMVSTHADWDYPSGEAVVRRAARVRADLIVAQCHPGEHRGFWPLRLTDWDLLRLSPVPVLLVKSKQPYRRPVILAAVDPAHAFAKPAKLDDEIVRAANAFSQALRGSLHAIHAYVPTPMDATGSEILNPEATEILKARARAHARARLSPLLKKTRIPLSRQHLVGEHPINAIPEMAEDLGCSILVMGAVSRSGLKRLFIGNTAERMLDEVRCDVLVVKPPQFARPIARAQRGARLIAPLLQEL